MKTHYLNLFRTSQSGFWLDASIVQTAVNTTQTANLTGQLQ
jgi:hypothetical protein